MRAKLALLLYYTLLYRARLRSQGPAGGRDPIALAAAGDELTWAAAALAALRRLTQPGYQLDPETRLSPAVDGLIPDTLHATIIYGAAETLTPARRICTPENQAAYIIAQNAAHTLRAARDPQLEAIVEGILKRTWLAAVRDCPAPSAEKTLREAAERIRGGHTPPRYQALLPLIQALLRRRQAPARAETGWIYSDEYAEIEALAAALEAYNATITPASVKTGTYKAPNATICHQPLLQIQDCRLQPDIAILDHKHKTITIIEVKTINPGQNPRERIREARRQLIEYLHVLRLPDTSICGENQTNYLNKKGIIAYKAYTAIEDTLEDSCTKHLGLKIASTSELAV